MEIHVYFIAKCCDNPSGTCPVFNGIARKQNCNTATTNRPPFLMLMRNTPGADFAQVHFVVNKPPLTQALWASRAPQREVKGGRREKNFPQDSVVVYYAASVRRSQRLRGQLLGRDQPTF